MVSTVAVLAATVRYAVVPLPALMIPQEGEFRITEQTTIDAPQTLKSVAKFAQMHITSATGFTPKAGKGSSVISFKLNPKLPRVGAEGYTLEVDQAGVQISSRTPAGAFYGLQTLRQLMSKDRIPSVIIEDSPRFGWRGAMLDTGRHFMPVDAVKKFIDTLAYHKLNTFHWHLTEDQGWRLEIKKYPKLTQIGSKRAKTMLKYSPAEYENKEYGGFYTQADAKEIVAYAAERFVNVVPEIEMPGHSQAAVAAYPELGNGQKVDVATTWGVIKHVYNPEEKTIQFLKDVMDEVMAIFPSKFIHVGGDECPKDEWDQSPRVQALIKERGLKDSHEMQSWFIKQMDTYLASKGRRLIGWDEILEGGLAPGATVMSWRGEAGGIAAAKQGHDVVMASTNALYFDYYQADAKTEPHAIGGFLPLRKVYEFEIVPKEIPAANQKHILGGQFQLWTEYIRTPAQVEYMAFPRGAAAAEILWSPKSKRNYQNFVGRLAPHVDRLREMGINVRKLDANLGLPTAAWKAGDVDNEYKLKEWDVTAGFTGNGMYSVKFLYTSGGIRLDVDGIEIWINGSMIASDKHYGRTGLQHVDNTWRVELKGVPAGAKVTMRAKVRGDGGSDSNGEITMWRD